MKLLRLSDHYCQDKSSKHTHSRSTNAPYESVDVGMRSLNC